MSSRVPTPATSRAPATTATIVIVSRRVIPGSSQPVPHTPHSDQRQGIAEFLAQLAHVDVDRPLIAVPPGPPHAVEDLLAAERQAHVLGQELQQVELPCGQGHDLTVDAHLPAPGIHLDTADERNVGPVPRWSLCPAQD